MHNIRIFCDTSSDLTPELAKELNVVMFPIPVVLGDRHLLDGVSYTSEEFYNILETSSVLPTTTHINVATCTEEYTKAYNEGCEAVIHVCNNSANSGMFNASNLARQFFFEEHPEAVGKFRIEPVDSHSFTLAYGFPVIKGARVRNAGGDLEEILEAMNKAIFSAEIYMAVYDLKFARLSGRVGAAAAFVGGMMGIRPVMSMIHGVSASVEKVRGNARVIPRLVQAVKENVGEDKEFAIMTGYPEEEARELERCLIDMGMKSLGIFKIGAAIAINIGPRVVAVTIFGKDRPRT